MAEDEPNREKERGRREGRAGNASSGRQGTDEAQKGQEKNTQKALLGKWGSPRRIARLIRHSMKKLHRKKTVELRSSKETLPLTRLKNIWRNSRATGQQRQIKILKDFMKFGGEGYGESYGRALRLCAEEEVHAQ